MPIDTRSTHRQELEKSAVENSNALVFRATTGVDAGVTRMTGQEAAMWGAMAQSHGSSASAPAVAEMPAGATQSTVMAAGSEPSGMTASDMGVTSSLAMSPGAMFNTGTEDGLFGGGLFETTDADQLDPDQTLAQNYVKAQADYNESLPVDGAEESESDIWLRKNRSDQRDAVTRVARQASPTLDTAMSELESLEEKKTNGFITDAAYAEQKKPLDANLSQVEKKIGAVAAKDGLAQAASEFRKQNEFAASFHGAENAPNEGRLRSVSNNLAGAVAVAREFYPELDHAMGLSNDPSYVGGFDSPEAIASQQNLVGAIDNVAAGKSPARSEMAEPPQSFAEAEAEGYAAAAEYSRREEEMGLQDYQGSDKRQKLGYTDGLPSDSGELERFADGVNPFEDAPQSASPAPQEGEPTAVAATHPRSGAAGKAERRAGLLKLKQHREDQEKKKQSPPPKEADAPNEKEAPPPGDRYGNTTEQLASRRAGLLKLQQHREDQGKKKQPPEAAGGQQQGANQQAGRQPQPSDGSVLPALDMGGRVPPGFAEAMNGQSQGNAGNPGNAGEFSEASDEFASSVSDVLGVAAGNLRDAARNIRMMRSVLMEATT